MAKRKTTIKPRNAGTMTESAFWGMIRSALRKRSMYWKPISIVKNESRRAITGKGNQKWEYQCNICKGWFKGTEVQVDHLIESGTLTCKDDVGGFIERLFCEKEGLQVLCNKREDGLQSCHHKKTFKNEK